MGFMHCSHSRRSDGAAVSSVALGACHQDVRRQATCCRAGGFTLVELMVTLAVAAILIAIAVPSFRNIMASNRLNTAANELVGAITAARMEAIQRNGPAQFCSNLAANNTADTLGASCGSNTGAVVALQNGVAVLVRAAPAGLIAPAQLSGNVVALRFNGQGLGYQAGSSTVPFDSTTAATPVADICTTALSAGNHRVINMATGSVLTTTTTTGTCP